jgi:hypothetical protein
MAVRFAGKAVPVWFPKRMRHMEWKAGPIGRRVVVELRYWSQLPPAREPFVVKRLAARLKINGYRYRIRRLSSP